MKIAVPVTGAFLAVAFADGKYEPSEENRFLAAIVNKPELAIVGGVALQSAYNDLVEDFRKNFPATKARVLEAIEAVKDDQLAADAIKAAARGAIVADLKIAPQEEFMLNEIAKALGIEAGSV